MASSRYFVGWVPFCRTSVAVVLLGLLPGSAFAKTPELSAIEVYPTGDAHGYVQISGFTLNAKNEMHICTGVQSISKNSYGKLPKITPRPRHDVGAGQGWNASPHPRRSAGVRGPGQLEIREG